ncbi:Tautomerase/MIF superfamily [Echria macrotheca]|uniref:L-dopachrome isomerase n=1 Tax=Echria macrotheca TaxID=438768 RepID=A0AAJ0F262_9PEZI|nr:Tautomerase/MIF superfamily [Echria macrotheca]
MNRPLSPVTATKNALHSTKSSPLSATPASKLSFADRKAKKENTPPAVLVEGGRSMRNIERPPPGDAPRRDGKSRAKTDLQRKRSAIDFFGDAFGVGESNSAAKERVRGDAIVTAEVKTNVIISDEFTFITELSYHLSTRYQRPVSSIVVTLHHGACMFFGGSFDAAYIMSIFALPSQLQPTTNKRNAALIQKHMEEALGVMPERGLLRFVPTPEENTAHKGKTMAGEIDELERMCSSPAPPTEVGGSGMRTGRKLSVKSLASFRPPSVPVPELTPPASADETLPPIPASPGLPPADAEKVKPEEGPKTAKRKKSFVATIFSRSGSKKEYKPGLTTIRGEGS